MFTGDFEVMDMPALTVDLPIDHRVALNDVSFLRQPHGRVAELSYAIGDEEVGSVRCDGLVAATPAGSTGYNLANNGPILAWGVKGYVVSFIAPHTLAARALVVAPDDALRCATPPAGSRSRSRWTARPPASSSRATRARDALSRSRSAWRSCRARTSTTASARSSGTSR